MGMSIRPVKDLRPKNSDVFRHYNLGFPLGCKMLQPTAIMSPIEPMQTSVDAWPLLEPNQIVSKLRSITIQRGQATVFAKNPFTRTPSPYDPLAPSSYPAYVPCISTKVAGSISMTFWGNDKNSITDTLACTLPDTVIPNSETQTLNLPFEATLLKIDVISTYLDQNETRNISGWGPVILRPSAICGFAVHYYLPSDGGSAASQTITFDENAPIIGSLDLESFVYETRVGRAGGIPGQLTDNVVVGFLPWVTRKTSQPVQQNMFVGIQFVVGRLPSQVAYTHLSDPLRSAAASPLFIPDSDIWDNHDSSLPNSAAVTNNRVGSSASGSYNVTFAYAKDLTTTFAVMDTNNTAINSSVTKDTNLSVVVYAGPKPAEAALKGSYGNQHSKEINISQMTSATLNSSTTTRLEYSQIIEVELAHTKQAVNVFTYKYTVAPSALSFPVQCTFIWKAFDGAEVSASQETELALQQMVYDIITAHVIYDVEFGTPRQG